MPLQGPSSCGRIADLSQNPSLCTTYVKPSSQLVLLHIFMWAIASALGQRPCRHQLVCWLHYLDAGTMAQFILSPVHQTQPSTPGKSHCYYGQMCNLTVTHSMVLPFICISLQHTLWHSHVYYIVSDYHNCSVYSISSPCFIAMPSLNTRRLLAWVLPGSLSCGG